MSSFQGKNGKVEPVCVFEHTESVLVLQEELLTGHVPNQFIAQEAQRAVARVVLRLWQSALGFSPDEEALDGHEDLLQFHVGELAGAAKGSTENCDAYDSHSFIWMHLSFLFRGLTLVVCNPMVQQIVERAIEKMRTSPRMSDSELSSTVSDTVMEVLERGTRVIHSTTKVEFLAAEAHVTVISTIAATGFGFAGELDRSQHLQAVQFAVKEIWRWAVLGTLLNLQSLFDEKVRPLLEPSCPRLYVKDEAGYDNVFLQALDWQGRNTAECCSIYCGPRL